MIPTLSKRAHSTLHSIILTTFPPKAYLMQCAAVRSQSEEMRVPPQTCLQRPLLSDWSDIWEEHIFHIKTCFSTPQTHFICELVISSSTKILRARKRFNCPIFFRGKFKHSVALCSSSVVKNVLLSIEQLLPARANCEAWRPVLPPPCSAKEGPQESRIHWLGPGL